MQPPEVAITQLLSFTSIFGSLSGAPLKHLSYHEARIWPTSYIDQAQVDLTCEGFIDSTQLEIKSSYELREEVFEAGKCLDIKDYIVGDQSRQEWYKSVFEDRYVRESLIELWAIDACSDIETWADLIR